MSSAKRQLCNIFIRNVSTNKAKQTTAQAVAIEDKDIYYQKIGSRAIENKDEVKPEGWDEAKPFEDIPGPKPLPIIGNMWRFVPGGEYYKLQMIDLHKRLHEQFGNLAYLPGIFGRNPVLFTYNPDDFEQVLRSAGVWPIRHALPSYEYYRHHLRNDIYQGVGGVFTVQGEEWFKTRSIVNKILMQPRTAEMYVSSMDEVANELIENIRYFSRNNPEHEMPENFQNELYKWSLESMGVIAYNKRIGCLDRNLKKDSEGQKLINSALILFELLYRLDFLPSLWRIFSTKNWKEYVRVLDFFTEINLKYVKECLAKANPDPNIPDHERSVLERLTKADKRVAFAMATDMIIAGVDTTGRTMASALYYLSKNPDKQEKLRKELKSHLPTQNSPITKELLKELPYLIAVVKETTRLAPISVGTMRTSVRDLVVSGYKVPKGTNILCVNIIPSMDDKCFVKAKEFIPERWLRTTNDELSYKNVDPFVSLPFGFGPRSCIGKRLANLELHVGVSKIIRNFKLSWHYPDAAFGTYLLYGIMGPLKIRIEELED